MPPSVIKICFNGKGFPWDHTNLNRFIYVKNIAVTLCICYKIVVTIVIVIKSAINFQCDRSKYSLSTIFDFSQFYEHIFLKVIKQLSQIGVNLKRYSKKCIFLFSNVLETDYLMYKKSNSFDYMFFIICRQSVRMCPIKTENWHILSHKK